jgi:DNA-directed RNA polymerase subunit RPC12/RpoP
LGALDVDSASKIELDPIDISEYTKIAGGDLQIGSEGHFLRNRSLARDESSPFENVKIFYSCNLCSKRFAHFKSLNMHMAQHQGNTECPICGKVATRRRNMLDHLFSNHFADKSIMSQVKGSLCLICNKRALKISNHMIRQHLDWLKCPKCLKKYESVIQMLNCLYEHVSKPRFEQVNCD